MACSADALSSRIFLNLLRHLKADRTFGVAGSLNLLLLSDTAILQLLQQFLLLNFVLVLAVTLWHLSTSPMALQLASSFKAVGATKLTTITFSS